VEPYSRDMEWAQRLAALNREEMMDRVEAGLGEWIGRAVQRAEAVACHHNYTERERHFGKQVWLSRKGAIDATKGTLGLIPGSMGSGSYVVAGQADRLALDPR